MSDFRDHDGRTHPGDCYWGCWEWFAPATEPTPPAGTAKDDDR
jgi:hypothetical protein